MYQLVVFAAIGVLFLMSVTCLKWSTETDNPRSRKLRFWAGIVVGLAALWAVGVVGYQMTHARLLLVVAALVTVTAVWAFRKTGGIPRAETTTPAKG